MATLDMVWQKPGWFTAKGREAVALSGSPYYATVVPARLKQPLIPWHNERNERDGEFERLTAERWHCRPNADIALITGEASGGICALDIDCHENGVDGWDAISSYEGEHGSLELEAMVSSKTGSGGSHIFFVDPSHSLRGYSNPDLGIDVRANGQLVIVPPSDHSTGSFYAWENSPFDVQIREASPALLEFIERCRPSSRSSEGLRKAEAQEVVAAGSRNETLFRIACGLVRCRAPQYLVEMLLLGLNRQRCAPPLCDSEVAAIAQSAETYRTRNEVNEHE